MRESKFKALFLADIQETFPDAILVTNTNNGIQGFPDTTIFGERSRVAHLEFKDAWNAKVQPNQPEYIMDLNKKSFARFVYPENADEVTEDLYAYLNSGQSGDEAARLSRGQQLSLAGLV